MLVSDRRPLVYQHLPTLCRISAVTVSVMSFCNGNLRVYLSQIGNLLCSPWSRGIS